MKIWIVHIKFFNCVDRERYFKRLLDAKDFINSYVLSDDVQSIEFRTVNEGF